MKKSELLPGTPLESMATPGAGLLVMLLLTIQTRWLLPSKRSEPEYQSDAPLTVLPEMITNVVLKNSTDFPLSVNVLLVMKMLDCLPAVCDSKAMAGSTVVVPLPP